jgi:hypothetical protein
MLVDGVATLMLPGMDKLAAAFVDSSASKLAVCSLFCNPVQLPSPLWRRLVPTIGVAPIDPAAELARVLVRAEMGADLFVPGKDVGARRRQGRHYRAATIRRRGL